MRSLCALFVVVGITSVVAAPQGDESKINHHIPASCWNGDGSISSRLECKKQFLIIPNPATWHKANINCIAENKQLASILNREEQRALDKVIIEEHMEDKGMWLGGNDKRMEGHFRWIGNKHAKMKFNNWAEGQPNNLGEKGEDCLEIKFRFNWYDSDCDLVKPYVCEYYNNITEVQQ